MPSYVVEGGRPVQGSIVASGNKNAALACIAAAVLTDEPVILRNIPAIEDVRVLLDIIVSDIGGEVTRITDQEWRISVATVGGYRISEQRAGLVRASILFVGSLLARAGRIELPPPGGDVIGRRRLDTHFLAIRAFGVLIESGALFRMQVAKLEATAIFLDEASVTATENSIMIAVVAPGETVIENAASEPHVQDLCRMLNSMGARISGVGTNVLTIHGVERLHGTDFRIGADYMEIGSLIGLAAVTRGDLVIEQVEPQHLKMIAISFGRLGIHWETTDNAIHVPSVQKRQVVPDIGNMIPKIDDAPWPGFAPDLISIAMVVACQVEGTVLIHEKLFESRMFFVDKLIAMGAPIVLCDPHRAVVSGPCQLTGAELTSPDVRAGMALVIAALCAEGRSVIHNVYQIERGYERLVPRLTALGAQIERIDDP